MSRYWSAFLFFKGASLFLLQNYLLLLVRFKLKNLLYIQVRLQNSPYTLQVKNGGAIKRKSRSKGGKSEMWEKNIFFFRLTCPMGKNPMWAHQKTKFKKEQTGLQSTFKSLVSYVQTACMDCLWQNLGPLYMSPVDWAGSVSETLPYLQIPCKIFDMFIWESTLAQLPRSQFFYPGSWISRLKNFA